MAETVASEDENIADAMEWTLSLLEIRHGEIASGWRRLAAMTPRCAAEGNVNILRQALMSNGEVLLGIAGLVDSDSEAPSERPRFNRKRPGLADIITFLRLRAIAKPDAARAFSRCRELDPLKRGPNCARCEIGLGLVEAARGEQAVAREHLKRGRSAAETEGHRLLAVRAQLALARLS